MRSNWIRAWIAAVAILVGVSAIVRDRVGVLLAVEEPVIDWLLDGTDTSRWEQADIISSPAILFIGTLIMVLIGAWLNWRIAIAVLFTTAIGWILPQFVQSFVGRSAPDPQFGAEAFPSLAVTQVGVFWGLIVLMLWWLRAPRLVWHIVVEVGVVLTLLVAVREVVSGRIWPSDAVGSVIVAAVALITAALVFESNTVQLPSLRERRDRRNIERAAEGSRVP